MRTTWSGVLVACAAMGLSAAHAAAPSPEVLSNACNGCHGTLGASAGPSMPNLAGQSKKAFIDSMKAFKSGERPSTIMGRLAKGYSDADIATMAEYFSKQKPRSYVQAVDTKKADRGGMLQEKHCNRCHLDDGQDFKDDAPIMAGQWLKYLQVQMDDYAAGKRKMSDKMAEKMKLLSREDVDAIAHFYASQKQGEIK